MNRSHRIPLYAVLTALVCAATLLNIPSPGGYSNFGDAIVLLSALIAGPYWGAVIGGVGSAMADLILGCAYYIPGTLIVKGLCALLCGLIFSIGSRENRHVTLRLLFATVPAEIWMVLGYFLYKSFLLGNSAGALVSLPRNCIQGAIGAAAAILLYSVLIKIPSVKGVSYYEQRNKNAG